MQEKYWELIIAEKETTEVTGKVETHMIVSLSFLCIFIYEYYTTNILFQITLRILFFFKIFFQLRRPLTVTECGKCWAITEKPMYLQWAIGPSFDSADRIRYHGRAGAGHSASKVRIFQGM